MNAGTVHFLRKLGEVSRYNIVVTWTVNQFLSKVTSYDRSQHTLLINGVRSIESFERNTPLSEFCKFSKSKRDFWVAILAPDQSFSTEIVDIDRQVSTQWKTNTDGRVSDMIDALSEKWSTGIARLLQARIKPLFPPFRTAPFKKEDYSAAILLPLRYEISGFFKDGDDVWYHTPTSIDGDKLGKIVGYDVDSNGEYNYSVRINEAEKGTTTIRAQPYELRLARTAAVELQLEHMSRPEIPDDGGELDFNRFCTDFLRSYKDVSAYF